MLHLDPLDPYKPPSCSGNKQKNYNNNDNIGRFPGGGLGNQNPARTIAHSPPGVKETLNYMLREKLPRGGARMRDDEREIQLFFAGSGPKDILTRLGKLF